MSAWAHLADRTNESYLEFMTGPYEQYVRYLPLGPTQLERALIHTPMLDLDHERRFACAQMGMDMSDFKFNHCWRLQDHLNTTEAHIAHFAISSHSRSGTHDATAEDDTALGGSQFGEDLSTPMHSDMMPIDNEPVQNPGGVVTSPSKDTESAHQREAGSVSPVAIFYTAAELESFMQSSRAQRRLESGPRCFRAIRRRKDTSSPQYEVVKHRSEHRRRKRTMKETAHSDEAIASR